jgi:transposase
MVYRAGSPDLTPIENLWGILKGRAWELGHEAKEELIGVIITARKGIEISPVSKPYRFDARTI